MWIVARYAQTAPFSLKSAFATSSGGKTVLVPTPYAIKMALLDAAIRTSGIKAGEQLFPLLQKLTILLEPPQDIVVFKTFSKIRRPVTIKDSKKPGETQEEFEARKLEKLADKMANGQYPLYSTIAYREYVCYQGTFQLAFSSPDAAPLPAELPQLLRCINYFGKRGGFVQLMGQPQCIETLPEGQFVNLTPDDLQTFAVDGTLQVLDDCGETLTFQRANVYSSERITLGKERILRHVVLPHHLFRSSRSYSWYRHI